MDNEMKKAFITGTFNENLLKRIEKALEYLGYSSIYNLENNKYSNEFRKKRIESIMDSDLLVVDAEPWGSNTDIFEKDVEIAKYLDIPIMQFNKLASDNLDQLECQVTRKLIDQLFSNGNEENDKKGDNEDD